MGVRFSGKSLAISTNVSVVVRSLRAFIPANIKKRAFGMTSGQGRSFGRIIAGGGRRRHQSSRIAGGAEETRVGTSFRRLQSTIDRCGRARPVRNEKRDPDLSLLHQWRHLDRPAGRRRDAGRRRSRPIGTAQGRGWTATLNSSKGGFVPESGLCEARSATAHMYDTPTSISVHRQMCSRNSGGPFWQAGGRGDVSMAAVGAPPRKPEKPIDKHSLYKNRKRR